MTHDSLRYINSLTYLLTYLKSRVIAIDVVRSEVIQISSRLMTQPAAKTDNQIAHS